MLICHKALRRYELNVTFLNVKQIPGLTDNWSCMHEYCHALRHVLLTNTVAKRKVRNIRFYQTNSDKGIEYLIKVHV